MKVSHLHSNHSASRRTHDLRHTTATLLGEAGTELRITSSVLGHAHLNTTADIYSEIRPATQRAALVALEHALNNQPQPR